MMTAESLNSSFIYSVSAQNSVGEAKLSSAGIRISAAVIWEKAVNTGGLWTLCAIVDKSAAAEKIANRVHCIAEKLLNRPENLSERVEIKLCIGSPTKE